MDSDGESDVRVNSTRNSSSHCSSSGSSRDDRSLAEDEEDDGVLQGNSFMVPEFI